MTSQTRVCCALGAAERAIDATRDAMMMMNFLMMGCLIICGWVTYFLCAACDEKDNKKQFTLFNLVDDEYNVSCYILQILAKCFFFCPLVLFSSLLCCILLYY